MFPQRFLLFLTVFSSKVVTRLFLGSEGSAIMINGQNLVMLGIGLFVISILFGFLHFPLTKKYGSRFIFVCRLVLIFAISSFFFLFQIYCLSCFLLFCSFYLPSLIFPVMEGYNITSSSSTGNEDSSSSTNLLSSSDELLSHSQAPNPEPRENLLSFFGAQNPDPEMELYARIRLLESLLIDRLPPQLNLGEYESLVRENLNQAFNLRHYQSALSQELFDVTFLELKANIIDQIFNLFQREPDDRLIQIWRESPFNEGSLQSEILEFLESKLEFVGLDNPRSNFEKGLAECSLRYWVQDLQERGARSLLYTGFVSYFRGSS